MTLSRRHDTMLTVAVLPMLGLLAVVALLIVARVIGYDDEFPIWVSRVAIICFGMTLLLSPILITQIIFEWLTGSKEVES